MRTTDALPFLMIASLSLASASPLLPLTLGASLLQGVRAIAAGEPGANHPVQRRAVRRALVLSFRPEEAHIPLPPQTTGEQTLISELTASELQGFDTNTKMRTARRSSSALAAAVVARSSTVGPAADSALAQAALNAHNNLRAQHGAAPLVWDDSLASAAQDWANKCPSDLTALDQTDESDAGVFQHGGGESLGAGENLAVS